MITFKQYITEWSDTPAGIKKHLTKLGYKYLGAGVDQSAYLEPKTGQVLKIFGTNRGANGTKFSRDHLMFKTWAEYCTKHQSNQFLPKFNGWESFEFNGKMYLQIRMEKLQTLPTELGFALQVLSGQADENRKKIKELKEKLNQILFSKTEPSEEAEEERESNMEALELDEGDVDELYQLVLLLGKTGFDKLIDTMAELAKIGRAEGYKWDLHSGNFMHRNDGVPVIVDPWVI